VNNCKGELGRVCKQPDCPVHGPKICKHEWVECGYGEKSKLYRHCKLCKETDCEKHGNIRTNTLSSTTVRLLTDTAQVSAKLGLNELICKSKLGEICKQPGCPVHKIPAMPSKALTDRQLATVLAALRYWQQQLESMRKYGGKSIPFVVQDFFIEQEPLSLEEIDDLCEVLNLR
jgi:hypothetical protein